MADKAVSKAKRTELYWNGFRDALVTGQTQVQSYAEQYRVHYQQGFSDGNRAVARIRRRAR